MDTTRIPYKLPAAALCAGLGLLLSACMLLGPDYKKPDLTLPADWQSPLGTANSPQNANINQIWWQNFADPILEQLITQAASGNLDLKIAETRITQARSSKAIAQAALMPSGNLMASVNRQANQIGFPGGNGSPISQIIKQPFNIFKTGFDASWELDLFGGHRREAEAAGAELDAAELSRDDLQISVSAEVARSYLEYRQYQTQLAIAEKILSADQKTYDIMQERYLIGDVAGLEVSRVTSQLEQDRSQIAYYQNLQTQAAYSLDLLVGDTPGATRSKLEPAVGIPQSKNELLLTTPAKVIAQRPDVRIAERRLAAATAQQGAALAKFFPDISLTGFIGLFNTNAANFINAGSKSWSMGANLLWPILSYGTLAANLDAADAKQQEALNSYQKAILSALSDIEHTLSAYQHQLQSLQALENAFEAEQNNSNIARERYAAGITSYLDVLEAEKKAYALQHQLSQAQALSTEQLIAVYKSLGGGWEVSQTQPEAILPK
jgi:outer membrane protein, multidrug efflux system